MDIKTLLDCGLVYDVAESTQKIEFKTTLYSAQTMQMETVLISCPLSGNHLLTESAQIVSGNVAEEDADQLLEQLFFGLEHSSSVRAQMDGVTRSSMLDSGLQRLAASFIEDAASNPGVDLGDMESLRFNFLKQCSINFQSTYERITEKSN